MEPSKTEKIVVPALVGVLLVGGWGYGISQFWWRKPSAEPPVAARQPLRPTAPGGRGIAMPTPIQPFVPADPQWRAKFDKVYTLEPSETVKRIATVIPERETFIKVQYSSRGGTAPTIGSIIFRFQNNQATMMTMSAAPARSVASLISLILSLSSSPVASSGSQIEVPPALQSLTVTGDWIFRPEATIEQRAAGLSAALSAATNKKLTIAQQEVERTGITVSGTYEFKALEGTNEPNTIQLFADAMDPAGSNARSGQVPVQSLVAYLGSMTGTSVTNQVQSANLPGNVTLRIHNSAANIQGMAPGPERDAMIDKLLANFTAQTGLECKKTQTKVTAWKLSEG
jgi:hypothetical protein